MFSSVVVPTLRLPSSAKRNMNSGITEAQSAVQLHKTAVRHNSCQRNLCQSCARDKGPLCGYLIIRRIIVFRQESPLADTVVALEVIHQLLGGFEEDI